MKRYIRSSEDFDEWDEYQGKKYFVLCGWDSFRTNNPVAAIRKWVQGQKKYPMDCSISTRNLEDAIALVKAGTEEVLTDAYKRYPGSPYKLDYMIEECKKKVADNCRWFSDNGHGDVVHPFGVG